MPVTVPTTSRKWTLVICSAIAIFIAIVVIIGICVRFLTEGKVQQIILITLICLLATVGMTAVIILDIRRRRTINEIKRKQNRAINYTLAPSAPRMSNTTAWNNSKNYSQRTTIQA